MRNQYRLVFLAGLCALLLPSCAEERETVGNSADLTEEMVFIWPAELNIAGEYPSPGNECRALGPSAATDDLDVEGSTMVACASEAVAHALPGKVVGKVKGVWVVAVPPKG